MKQHLLTIIGQIQEDARFFIYEYNEDGTFKSVFKEKPYVLSLIQDATDIQPHENYDDVILVNGNMGLWTKSFSENIDYPTENTEGFMEYISQYNPYYKVFIKLDEEKKTITFKLGDKEKTLELIERTNYVSKPHYKKYMKCVSVEDLKKHIDDKFWNPRMVDIGRIVLGLKDFKVSSFLEIA
ncbi:hypothetical protein CVD28_01620 [Bacillus sp. M6-12]|uniref:hypothetical protein n=1 Tax=Bacillus sp. M6-12 TaxID=2054166 RepID=UPI000C7842E8|nr:hypothetical protein [Bacillus sp. M6-12]PLS19132.1 hypothetical protein CVD28_01620 [Bacillus sp. M6-12]